MIISSRVLSVAALLLCSSAGSWAQERPAVGQPFPSLVLPTVDGSGVIDLADLRGRKLLLIEFASW